jgi:homoserine dehydrogenase
LGWVAFPDGAPTDVLNDREQLAALGATSGLSTVRDWLAAGKADVLFENTSLDTETGQPAIDHLQAALERGAHALTANKGPNIHAYHALRDLAAKQGKAYYFESSVVDSVPIFSLFRSALPASELIRFHGLFNATTSVILGAIESGKSFDEAVAIAQGLGIAETDPSADVDGWDAAVKVAAIAIVLMDIPLKLSDIQVTGIRGLSAEQIRAARAEGKPYKLVSRAERVGDNVIATVRPEQVPADDPMAVISPQSLMVHFETDIFKGLSLTEFDPGPMTTAYGLLCDFINAAQLDS